MINLKPSFLLTLILESFCLLCLLKCLLNALIQILLKDFLRKDLLNLLNLYFHFLLLHLHHLILAKEKPFRVCIDYVLSLSLLCNILLLLHTLRKTMMIKSQYISFSFSSLKVLLKKYMCPSIILYHLYLFNLIISIKKEAKRSI